MKELKKYINKEIQKKYLTIFFILDEIAHKENIISFNYSNNILMVQTGLNDYYRIHISEEVKEC